MFTYKHGDSAVLFRFYRAKNKMKKSILLSLLVASTATAELPLTGGKTTTKQMGTAAFSQPAANLPLIYKVDFSVGNSFFRNPWVIAPSSTTARDGLGPLFNTNGCQNCHIRDGRGHAPMDENDNAVSMLIRLSIAPKTPAQQEQQRLHGPIPEPNYGGQLQDFAIPGVEPEGQIKVQWQNQTYTYPDGSETQLRKPTFDIVKLGYGDFHPDLQTSARIAPAMIGLGLLELISETDLLANEDVDDHDQDGISGRANRVWNIRKQAYTIGRFGWKAGMPTLEQQNAGAFAGDIGITSELSLQTDCTAAQTACLKAPNGESSDEKELQHEVLNAVTFYTHHLAVPIQRNHHAPAVKHGEKLFYQVGCQGCHTAEFTSIKHPLLPALSEQTFHPFSDLLLHDMGPELADNREEFLATGSEWRTAPLWGLGYLMEVNQQIALLHDGRAQSIEEAILWHGGEAKGSKQKFTQLSKADREALLAFLNSL